MTICIGNDDPVVIAHKLIETPANGLFWSGVLLVLYALVERGARR